MSAPPPYYGGTPDNQPPPNPDGRELPPGWVPQYDWNYKQWFYVYTRESPPRSSWTHPLGPPPSRYAPPSGPPPPDNRGGYDGRRSPYAPQPGSGGWGGSPQPVQQNWGPPQQAQNWGPPPPQRYGVSPQPAYSEGRSFFGGGSSQSAAAPKKSGFGTGTLLAAGAGGLIGGALLEDVFENHEQNVYDQGYNNGEQADGGDYGGGGDYGDGGNFGDGGDF